MNYLNLGCGSTFHSYWINLDVSPSAKEVKRWDIRKNLPFTTQSIDVCYSSHVIEHLSPSEARILLRECMRVLKSNGIIRLVVPDLEAIIRLYLEILSQLDQGIPEAEANYDWVLLEMYDQAVRNFSGGEMGKYLSRSDLSNHSFIVSRIGQEAENFWQNTSNNPIIYKSLGERFNPNNLSGIVKKLKILIARFFVLIIAGKESAKAFDIGLFRKSGEIHQWMYDRFSLARLLKECGFVNIRICQAHESNIPDFTTYSLDLVDSKVRKPDSLFIEAFKP